MANDFLDCLRELDILDCDLVNGEPRSKLGTHAAQEGYIQDAGHWGLAGVVALPDLPDDTGACEALTITDGAQTKVIATRDNRYTSKIGAMSLGTKGFVTRGAARLLLNPEKAAITAYTERDDDGTAMMIEVSGARGVINILNGGAAIELHKDKIVFMVDQGGTLTIDKNGVSMSGPNAMITTAAVYLGAMPGGVPPPPAPILGCGIGASPITVPSTKVFVAP